MSDYERGYTQGVEDAHRCEQRHAQIGQLEADVKVLRDERDLLRRDYDELIMAVGNKYPGETRHQTALRYIQRAEEPSNVPAKAALTPTGGGQEHD